MIMITRAASSSPPNVEPITTPVVPALPGSNVPIVPVTGIHCDESFIGTVSTQKGHYYNHKDTYSTTSHWITHVDTGAIGAPDV